MCLYLYSEQHTHVQHVLFLWANWDDLHLIPDNPFQVGLNDTVLLDEINALQKKGLITAQ